jgi:hypothetical protein
MTTWHFSRSNRGDFAIDADRICDPLIFLRRLVEPVQVPFSGPMMLVENSKEQNRNINTKVKSAEMGSESKTKTAGSFDPAIQNSQRLA